MLYKQITIQNTIRKKQPKYIPQSQFDQTLREQKEVKN